MTNHTDEPGPITYACAVCGEVNETTFDPEAGDAQEFIEDCRVCCRPNVVRVYYDRELGAMQVEASFEE